MGNNIKIDVKKKGKHMHSTHPVPVRSRNHRLATVNTVMFSRVTAVKDRQFFLTTLATISFTRSLLLAVRWSINYRGSKSPAYFKRHCEVRGSNQNTQLAF
jgi:hypothetical protein